MNLRIKWGKEIECFKCNYGIIVKCFIATNYSNGVESQVLATLVMTSPYMVVL